MRARARQLFPGGGGRAGQGTGHLGPLLTTNSLAAATRLDKGEPMKGREGMKDAG